MHRTRRDQQTALDRMKQTALQGRRIDILQIGAFSRQIDQAIANGHAPEDAIAMAVQQYTEPAP